jgi:hypothetical protein
MNRKHTLISLFSAAALLAACGGGGGGTGADAPASADAVPPEASQSTAGLMSYLSALGAMPVEGREALDLGGFAPKSDDEAEPWPLR